MGNSPLKDYHPPVYTSTITALPANFSRCPLEPPFHNQQTTSSQRKYQLHCLPYLNCLVSTYSPHPCIPPPEATLLPCVSSKACPSLTSQHHPIPLPSPFWIIQPLATPLHSLRTLASDSLFCVLFDCHHHPGRFPHRSDEPSNTSIIKVPNLLNSNNLCLLSSSDLWPYSGWHHLELNQLWNSSF